MADDMKNKPKHGDIWLNLISGAEYIWDETDQLWHNNKKYPYGPNPMGFLGDGVTDGP